MKILVAYISDRSLYVHECKTMDEARAYVAEVVDADYSIITADAVYRGHGPGGAKYEVDVDVDGALADALRSLAETRRALASARYDTLDPREMAEAFGEEFERIVMREDVAAFVRSMPRPGKATGPDAVGTETLSRRQR